MSLDLQSLFPDLEALTPDGRWAMLQDWLSKNPEYAEHVEEWSQQTTEEVFDAICILAVGKYGALAGMFLMSPTIKTKLMRSIEILQACYRERAGETEKEIKHVSTRRIDTGHKKNVRRQNRPNPKRSS
jgi:hypothetical protein